MRWELDGHIATYVPVQLRSYHADTATPMEEEEEGEAVDEAASPTRMPGSDEQLTRDMRMQRFALPHAAASEAAVLCDTVLRDSTAAAAAAAAAPSCDAATKRARTVWLQPAEATLAETETAAEAAAREAREVTWTPYMCEDNTPVFLQVCVNPTQVCVNPAQVCVNPTHGRCSCRRAT
jgi:hypothetical protein